MGRKWVEVCLIWTEQETPIILSLLLLFRFYFPGSSIGSAHRDMKFLSSSSDFIPWNSVVAENVYMVCCSIHFPPSTKQTSSLCPEGIVTGVILSQFYLFYTKIQFNIILLSLLYRILPNSIFCSCYWLFIRIPYALLARCLYLLSHSPYV